MYKIPEVLKAAKHNVVMNVMFPWIVYIGRKYSFIHVRYNVEKNMFYDCNIDAENVMIFK